MVSATSLRGTQPHDGGVTKVVLDRAMVGAAVPCGDRASTSEIRGRRYKRGGAGSTAVVQARGVGAGHLGVEEGARRDH